MTANFRIRDQLRGWVPWWLSGRHYASGRSVGFRFLWVMVAVFDVYIEYVLQALQAAWPGRGTPTKGHSEGRLGRAYAANAVFDNDADGRIQIRELELDMRRNWRGCPCSEIETRSYGSDLGLR